LLLAVLGGALRLPAFRAGLFVARFARLLRGPSPGTVVAAIVAVLHALRLRVRWRDDGEHHDASQHAHASPRTSLHAVLLLVQRSFGRHTVEQEVPVVQTDVAGDVMRLADAGRAFAKWSRQGPTALNIAPFAIFTRVSAVPKHEASLVRS
jgi:hypothetical protein